MAWALTARPIYSRTVPVSALVRATTVCADRRWSPKPRRSRTIPTLLLLQDAVITLTPVLHHAARSGLFGADRGSREKNVGQSCPGDRECTGNTGVSHGAAWGTAGAGESPTGSATPGLLTLCHPVRGSAGDGARVQREPPRRTEGTVETNRLDGGARLRCLGHPRSRSEKARLVVFGLQARTNGASGSGQTLGVVARPLVPGRTPAPEPPHGVSADTGSGAGACARWNRRVLSGRLATKSPPVDCAPCLGRGSMSAGCTGDRG